ncbi:MAG: trigger factor [Pseudomonadota bacterium]
MSHEVETVDAVSRRIRFQIPVERVSSELNAAYRGLSGRVRLPGFRKGKVPRSVLELRYSKQVLAEVAGKLIQQGWEEVKETLTLLGQPQVEQDGVTPGQPFSFTFLVEVKPEIALGTYRGVEVPWLELDVPPEAVDDAVSRRLEAAARIVEIEDPEHAIGEGDIVMAELTLRSGEDVVATEAGTSLRVGEDPYYPGADALLVGLHRGGEAQGQVTIAESSEYEHLRGRTLEASVKVLSVRSSRAPAPSDEAARELGYEGGIEGMRAALTEEIRQPMEEHARSIARSALLSKLVEAHDLKAPRAMIEKQLELLVMERRVLHHYQGGKPGTLDLGPKVMAQLHARAIYAVKAGLLLEAIAGAEGLTITDQDLEDTYQRIADERGQRVEAVKGYLLQEEGAVDTLRSRLLEEKVLDWLFEQANLVAATPESLAADMAQPDVVAAEPEPQAFGDEVAEVEYDGDREAPAPEAEPQAAPTPTWSASMKKDELLAIAKELGLEVNTKSTKAQILEALEAPR